MSEIKQFFKRPPLDVFRRYEILRACLHDEESAVAVAARFGRAAGTVRNLCSAFRKDPIGFFDLPARRPPTVSPDRQLARAERDRRILELRAQGLSSYDIARRFEAEGEPCGRSTVAGVIKAAGLPPLRRRPRAARVAAVRPESSARADHRQLDLTQRHFHTQFGGLFLFAGECAELVPTALLRRAGLPGTAALPADCAVRSLLGLKLWGIGRPSHAPAYELDPGLALFAGLNAVPSAATLTQYSCRVDPVSVPRLMHGCLGRAHRAGLPAGRSFDLDFHTIPYHGDAALMEKVYVSKRSRRQRGVLAFLARDAEAGAFCYANAAVTQATASQEILRFVDFWEQRTGQPPAELVFDSGLTTQAVLLELVRRGIRFLTLRRRSPGAVAAVEAAGAADWDTVTLHNIGRAYRNPRVWESPVLLPGHEQPLRQLAVRDLGHERAMLLLTNHPGAAGPLIDRYARRMLIENAIANGVKFFHMDVLSSTIPMRIDFDLQLTLIANMLYSRLGDRLGTGYQRAHADKIFRDVVNSGAMVHIEPKHIHVRFGRRSRHPLLRAAGIHNDAPTIPWLGSRRLHLHLD